MTKNGTNIEKRIEEIEAEIRELKEEKKCLEHDLKALSCEHLTALCGKILL